MDADNARKTFKNFELTFFQQLLINYAKKAKTNFNSMKVKGRIDQMGTIVSIAFTEVHDRIQKLEHSQHYMKIVCAKPVKIFQ